MTTQREKQLEIWRKDPIAFMVEALDVEPEHVWPKMREVAESVRDYPKTAVGAGHGVSKTYTAARLVLWFLYCHCPATVITTAPTHKQVEELLWREIRLAHTNAKFPLGGKLTRTKLDLQDETNERWYALGFSTKPETVTGEATAMQGYHNDNIMVIFDEAAGILPQIWKAAQHLLTSGHTRQLVIGNPTSPTGEFAECVSTDKTWHVVNISVKDTPNFKEDREIIPGLSGKTYESNIRQKYGENSNEYKVRILGEMPDFGEGTFFGKELALAHKNEQFGFYPHREQAKVYTVWDIGPTHTVIWFVQFIKETIRIIDFIYDSKGLGLPAHLAMLQQRPYIYAQHFVPWDIGGQDNRPGKVGSNARNYQTGRYTIDVARELGFSFTAINKYGLDDQYAAGRGIIPVCLFHKPLVSEGWQGLSQFRKKLNPTLSTTDKPIYHNDPVKDWTEHIGSAFCGLACVYRYELVIKDQHVGYGYPGAVATPEAVRAFSGEDAGIEDVRDWLKVG